MIDDIDDDILEEFIVLDASNSLACSPLRLFRVFAIASEGSHAPYIGRGFTSRP